MKNLRISDLISNYCIQNDVSVVYYEIKYSNDDERQQICDFYSDKLDTEYIAAMKNDDDCFFEYQNEPTASIFAETNFPIYREIVGVTKNPLLYVFCCVYNNKGEFVWDNSQK